MSLKGHFLSNCVENEPKKRKNKQTFGKIEK